MSDCKSFCEEEVPMRLCITSTMDFYIDCEFQTNHDITHNDASRAERFDKAIYDSFVTKLYKAFPAGNFSIRSFDVSSAYEANSKAA